MADQIQPRGPAVASTPAATPAPVSDSLSPAFAAALAANPQGGVAYGNGGVTQYTTPTYTPPATPAQYPVMTADAAKQDLNSKQQNLNAIRTGMATQQQINAQQQAVDTQNKAVADQTTAEQSKAKALRDAALGLSGTPVKSDTQVSLEDINKRADQAYEDYKAQIDQLKNGTFPLSPSEQAQIDYVKKQFEALKQQQITANKNFEGSMNQLGIVSGRSRYAPEIQVGIVQNTVNEGLKKVADIEAQAANTVAQLQSAFEDKNYARINQSYKALTDYLNQKSQVITQIASDVRAQAQLSLEQYKQQYQEQQDEAQKQRAAIQFALDNKIEKPFYLVGNTAIDTNTGEKVDLAEYQRRTGQKVGLPESQTDFSQIQTDVKTPQEREEEFKQQQFAYQQKQDAIQNNFRRQEIGISAGNLALQKAKFAADTAAAGGNLTGDVQNAISLAVGGLKFSTVADRKAAQATIASLLAKGDIQGAKEQLQTYVRNSASSTQQDVLDGKQNAIASLEKIKQGLATFQAKGGNTNIFTGLSEKALEKGGFTKDPQLAGLANDIALAIIDYRRAVSGAAFTESEKKSYDAVFPSIGNTSTLNIAKLDSLENKFKTDAENFYKQRVGTDKYNAIFGSAQASQDLDNFIKSNPDKLSIVSQIEKENPTYTDADILQIIQGTGSSTPLTTKPKSLTPGFDLLGGGAKF